MRKTTERTCTEHITVCDECHEHYFSGSGQVNVCVMCKRDVCRACTTYDNREVDDYSLTFCQTCWWIGKPYRESQETAKDEYDEKVGEIESEWKAECLRHHVKESTE